ncbi:tyrosine-type recombinase/integrase [Methylobacterium planeticum]|uniref:Tyrosine-type recombinase/integrase n=1 Tax=Methylobacterium planeticum TaxID=2615211 RepID=A0A6N6MSW1_9HYPH|nr:tyrosine-type recombinase/integrase [Methylobacterium planeticum]KAB1072507.1 tyrosine-type recombinase/integrase [Methylobacterium planeticum]
MPRNSRNDTRWLERHHGSWRVTVAVPRELHKSLGTRLKKALDTDSLSLANRLKFKVVADLKERIELEREAAQGSPRGIMREATKIAELSRRVTCDEERDELQAAIRERAAEIVGPEAREIVDPRTGEAFPLPDPGRASLAADFVAVANGRATPLATHHAEFIGQAGNTMRTRADDVRAIQYLTEWCRRERLPATLEAVTPAVALRFKRALGELAGGIEPATQKKYLNRLSVYWTYLAENEFVAANVWAGLKLKRKKVDPREEERAFTDDEVRRLMEGPAPPKLRDVMAIGALTGARLDAIVDLKVKHCIDGAFTFKPQKKERSERDVPIHPALVELVANRSAGKAPDDDLFPEWPKPRKAGSLRERSFKTSNAFTAYRRFVGVDHVLPGKRRSLVNFHSFRRWFITKAEQADVPEPLIAAIVGHKRTGITLGRYSQGPAMRQARRAVGKVKLPPLDGLPVREVRSLRPASR